MYVILVYDINRKRVAKIHKICRKYLRPVQKSVFEGDITQKLFGKLRWELERNIIKNEDAVCIYEMDSEKYASKLQIGIAEEFTNIL